MLNLLLFIFSYLAGFLLTFLSLPIYSFVVYQAVYFFNPVNRWWGASLPDLPYSFFTVALMIYAYIINLKKHNTNKIWAIPQLKYFILLVFLFYITSFYAIFPDLHSRYAIDYIKLLITMLIAFKLCDSDKKLDIILYAYIFGAWYVSCLAFQTGRNVGSRVEGIGTVDAPDSNGIALAIAPCLIVCFYYFWVSKKTHHKALFVLAGLFIANALILINSRGAFLAAAAGMLYFIFYLFFSKSQRKYQKTMCILVIIVGLAGTYSLADKSFINRIASIAQQTETMDNTEKESGTTRVKFWIASVEMAKDFPLGEGAKAFEFYAPFYIPEDVNTGRTRHRAVHSTWFEVLTEIGYLGLLLFLLMLYFSFKTLRICKKHFLVTNDFERYYKVVLLQAILWSFIVGMSFMNRMRAEVLYWLILYSACAYNIYILKPKQEVLKNDSIG